MRNHRFVGYSLTLTLEEAIRDLAKKEETSASALVRKALEEFLARKEAEQRVR